MRFRDFDLPQDEFEIVLDDLDHNCFLPLILPQ
jgi:hypothetical protein